MADRSELIESYLGSHVNECVSYRFSLDGGTTWAEANTLLIRSDGRLLQRTVKRNGTVLEVVTECPSPGVIYTDMRIVNDAGVATSFLDPPPSRQGSPQPAPPGAVTKSEEQRAQLLMEQRAASVQATAERAFLGEHITALMKTIEDKAAEERARAAALAEQQRLTLLQTIQNAEAAAKAERKAAADVAEQQRLTMLQAIQQLSTNAAQSPGAMNIFAAQSRRQSKPRRTLNEDDDDEELDDDAFEATDVDDAPSCKNAQANWKTRCRACPKQNRHLVPWFAGEQKPEEFQSRWARKLESCEGVRDTVESTALLSLISDLQRALAATSPDVARYAVSKALGTVFCMAQRLEMRSEHASFEALAEFDLQMSAVDRKVRRRATDFQHSEQVAAAATRKYPAKAGTGRGNRSRSRGGGRGYGDSTWSQNQSQHSQQPGPGPAPAPAGSLPAYPARGFGNQSTGPRRW